jgi:MFS family permease
MDLSLDQSALTHRPTPLPRSIWALGIVSLFMDTSTEMIASLLPAFLVTVLGASTELLGVMEGLAGATASATKFVSGWLSDRLGHRKELTVLGYGMAALAKPLFAFAPSAPWVLGARVADRVGKGIRDTPRDALIGDIVQPGQRGAAYGLRQSLDTLGALIGPLTAMVLMELLGRRIRAVFLLAIIPAFVAVLVLLVGVREPDAVTGGGPHRLPMPWKMVRELCSPVWAVLGSAVVLILARFSEAFLLLRAQERGLMEALVPLVLVVMNAVYALAAYPIGALSDRLGRRRLLLGGFAVLLAAHLTLALASGAGIVLVGAALWGLHMGMTQGLLPALVADRAPPPLRGVVFGLFNLCMGLALLIANVIAGVLWQEAGPAVTFASGAALAALGSAVFILVEQKPCALVRI